jgi:hypothetical protein
MTAASEGPRSTGATTPPAWTWPAERDEAEVADLAISTLPLLLDPHRWVHRRVEGFVLLDEARLRRRVSVDFTVPNTAYYRRQAGLHQAAVPLAQLRKRVLRNLDVRDESGTALPVLSQEENRLVAYAMLVLTARRALRLTGAENLLPQRLVDLLRRFVSPDAEESDRAFAEARKLAEAGWEPALWSNARMLALTGELARHFVLYARLRVRPGQRRVIKFAYDEEFRLANRPLAWLGTSSAPLTLSAWSIGAGYSYHAEIAAPGELFIESARLVAVDLEAESPQPWTGLLDPSPSRAEPLALDQDGPTVSAHLHSSGAPRQQLGAIQIRLCLRHPFIASNLLIAAITTLILVGGVVLRAGLGVHTRPDPLTALLVVVPGLYAVYLAAPGEHKLFQRLVTGVRLRVLLSAALAFLAAASVTLDLGEPFRYRLWLAAGLVSFVNTGLFASAFLRSRQLERRHEGRRLMGILRPR